MRWTTLPVFLRSRSFSIARCPAGERVSLEVVFCVLLRRTLRVLHNADHLLLMLRLLERLRHGRRSSTKRASAHSQCARANSVLREKYFPSAFCSLGLFRLMCTPRGITLRAAVA